MYKKKIKGHWDITHQETNVSSRSPIAHAGKPQSQQKAAPESTSIIWGFSAIQKEQKHYHLN